MVSVYECPQPVTGVLSVRRWLPCLLPDCGRRGVDVRCDGCCCCSIKPLQQAPADGIAVTPRDGDTDWYSTVSARWRHQVELQRLMSGPGKEGSYCRQAVTFPQSVCGGNTDWLICSGRRAITDMHTFGYDSVVRNLNRFCNLCNAVFVEIPGSLQNTVVVLVDCVRIDENIR